MKKSAFVMMAILALNLSVTAAPEPRPPQTPDQRLTAAGLKIDKAFSGKERIDLARGLSYIPFCLREKLRGLRVRRAIGDFYGQRPEGSNHIKINPTYFKSKDGELPDDYYHATRDGGFVHEVFHVIGEWNDKYYYRAYLALDPEGECPVSDYGSEQDIVEEDFAEAARLIYVPATRGDRRKDSCVDVKLKKLKKIFDACR